MPTAEKTQNSHAGSLKWLCVAQSTVNSTIVFTVFNPLAKIK